MGGGKAGSDGRDDGRTEGIRSNETCQTNR